MLLIITGKLPDCRMSLCKGFTQGGSNADVVLADSFLKNITDDVDWATGYEAVVSDAEGKLLMSCSDPRDSISTCTYGRYLDLSRSPSLFSLHAPIHRFLSSIVPSVQIDRGI